MGSYTSFKSSTTLHITQFKDSLRQRAMNAYEQLKELENPAAANQLELASGNRLLYSPSQSKRPPPPTNVVVKEVKKHSVANLKDRLSEIQSAEHSKPEEHFDSSGKNERQSRNLIVGNHQTVPIKYVRP